MSQERKPHFSELVWESTEQGIPIPPRGSSETLPAKPAKAKTSSGYDNVQLQLWDVELETPEPVTTTESQFVQRAKELEEHKEEACLLVPFKSYWPTYGHMTGAQSRWYFYWRHEVRQGKAPKTDLSYIFLHVYELINGVGWKEPQEGYRQLCHLWESYREQYKRLDQYLSGWIADFTLVHKLEVPLTLIVARSRGLAGDLAELELIRCLSSAPEQLSFEVLSAMSDYDISKSKFYLGEGKAACELYIPRVVALIDAYVTRKHGNHLLGLFPPGEPVTRERYLFRSAVYDISLYGYSVLVPVVRISKSPPLRSLITRLFRLTENKLRGLLGFRGRLKDVKVDADMEELVTRFLEREFRREKQQDKGPAVVIDREKLERLEQDSEIVRSLLTIEETEPMEEAESVVEAVREAGMEVMQESAAADAVTGAEDGLDRAAVDTASGMEAQGGLNRAAVAAVTGAEDVLEEPAANAGTEEQIALGTASVTAASAISYTRAHTAEDENGTERASEAEKAEEPTALEQLAAALSPLQQQLVSLLIEGGGLQEASRLAAAQGFMAELLMDEMNELAMEIIGDLLIDGDEVAAEYSSISQYLKR
ncbi:TerB N-terminal domain-containing protein [Paenibacillus donghaensis]|uniref:TerB-C domain-containing protein n=1 Tax=Paenibacillus donghaensis TaxID=414771 RepID=A0A2Z2KL09_9BACL|nr:TerB N-terminal domain-containing protein [Paenibacillus donghaensis]ASA21712.1 hypothetical protein B9T62_13600 [Paenibacillus donghaensis]